MNLSGRLVFLGLAVTMIADAGCERGVPEKKPENPLALDANKPNEKPLQYAIEEGIVAEYDKHFAEYGEWRLNKYKYLQFYQGKGRTMDGVPGFVFVQPMHRKYPRVPVQFGIGFTADAHISDENLEELSQLPNLVFLDVHLSAITDKGVKELSRFKDLSMLDLGMTKITDAALKDLGSLEKLTFLRLDNNRITESSLIELARLKKLTSLSLHHLPLTDAGVKHLIPLKNLKSLWLDSTSVSDVGVQALATLDLLEVLSVRDTNVSELGVNEL